MRFVLSCRTELRMIEMTTYCYNKHMVVLMQSRNFFNTSCIFFGTDKQSTLDVKTVAIYDNFWWYDIKFAIKCLVQLQTPFVIAKVTSKSNTIEKVIWMVEEGWSMISRVFWMRERRNERRKQML